jgi:hypothetical protein
MSAIRQKTVEAFAEIAHLLGASEFTICWSDHDAENTMPEPKPIHAKDLEKRVFDLVNISCDDCKMSLAFITDLDVLNAAKEHAAELGAVTKVRLITSRIRQVQKLAV